jgi:hypothetical protein
MVPSSVTKMKVSPKKSSESGLNTWPVGADGPLWPSGGSMVTDRIRVPSGW